MDSSTPTIFPLYAKACITLLLLLLIGAIVFVGKDIIVPFAFSVLIAVLLLPITNFLESKKIGRVLAIMISLVISILFCIAIVYFLASQIAHFTQDLPALKKHIGIHFTAAQNWLTLHFNISKIQQASLVDNAADNLKNSGLIGDTVLSVTQLVSVLVLIPVYVFLLLYYRDMMYNFFLRLFDSEHSPRVKEVLQESRYIVQGYMIGLIVEMGIVAAINTTGFLVLGISYAIFLGVLAAILNMIPYIGMLIASVFCAIITLSTSNQLTDVIGVIVVLIVVQFIDNNVIMPKVVSSKVKINALITILGVLIGGALAGVSGMFLSIPTIAILKVIFDRVEGLQAWGILLGDEITGKKSNTGFRKKKIIAPIPDEPTIAQ
jgi:predicted PurR-regulated permease PerM